MRTLLFIALLCFCGAPRAEPITVAPKGSTGPFESMRLHEASCTEKSPTVAQYLLGQGAPAEFVFTLKAATLRWAGKDWQSCWVEAEGVIYSIDEEGARLQPIPKELFKESTL